MPDDALASATSDVVKLDQQLLDFKLTIPEFSRQGFVSRASLIEAARASGRRVIGVTAPAGYGKSTLLEEWTRIESRQVAWVSLDRFDNDPATLLTLLATAFSRITPSAPHLADDVRGYGSSALGRAAPLLASALNASPTSFVLMLDDLHEIRSDACHDVLEVVVAGIPAGSQLVAASRGEQPHLPRARAATDAFEITSGQLALDAAGARRIFALAHLRLGSDDADEVVDRTEGWPVGIALAAQIARESGGTPLEVSGDDRYVADYLYRESLANLSDDLQHFLRQTAVLDEMSAPLCDAILGTHHSQLVLRELEASAVFLIPLDRRRTWYRYHSLFREFLLGELHRTEPEAALGLHVRAAAWYEAHGSTPMAIEHLLDHPTESTWAARLVAAIALPTYQDGQLSTVERWLRSLGDSAIEAYPPLAVLAGWIAALGGRAVEAERWSALLERSSYDQIPDDGSASFESARAMLRSFMCPLGPDRALEDALFACEAEPAWSPWRDQALVALGEAYLLGGNIEAAEQALRAGSESALAAGNTDVLVLSEAELASISMDAGRWEEGGEHVRTALHGIDERRMQDYATAVPAFAQAARLALHHGDLGAAQHELTRAMRARPACTQAIPFIAVRARLHLAKVYRALQDTSTALHLLREIDDIIRSRPQLGALIDQVNEFRSLLAASEPAVVTSGPPLTPAEVRLLPYMQTHLTLQAIAERLFLSRNTVSSQLASIYRKLGVSARGEAVEQARLLGMLGA